MDKIINPFVFMLKKDHFSKKQVIFEYRGKRLDRFLEGYEERTTDIEVPG